MKTKSLLQAMNSAFWGSKICLGIAIWCSIAIGGLSLAQEFGLELFKPLYLAGIVLALQIGTYISRFSSITSFDSGETLRRIFILWDGLDRKPERSELARLCDQHGVDPNLPIRLDGYYESALPPSVQRLASHIHESSFFTERLASSSARFFGIISALGIFASIFLLIALLNSGKHESIYVINLTKAFLVAMTFWVTGDFLTLTIAYAKLSASAASVCNRSNPSDPGMNDESNVLLLLGDYNCATASAPPIFNFIHRCRNQSLNRSWKASAQSRSAP